MSADACGVYHFGGEPVALSAESPGVAAALRRILRPPSLDAPVTSAPTAVSARKERDGWQLQVDGSIVRVLGHSTPVPRVAEKLIATACTAAAGKKSSILMRGAFLAKDGVTVALVGDDLDSAKVLGFHLHSRGWSVVSFGYAFVSEATLEVIGLPALVSVSSSAIDQVPPRYRAAIEASLWYCSGFELTFYNVDPLLVNSRTANDVVLTHVVIVDGAVEDKPSLTSPVEVTYLGPLGAQALAQHLHVARLTLGAPIASCSVVERWAFRSSASRDLAMSRQSPKLEPMYES